MEEKNSTELQRMSEDKLCENHWVMAEGKEYKQSHSNRKCEKPLRREGKFLQAFLTNHF